MTKTQLPLVAFALLGLAGCDDAPEPKELTGAEAAQYAVVSSDYSSTSISLLGAKAELVADDYINSGSVEAGLVAFLSGDVDLPTASNDPGVLVIIDRFKTDVITRIRLSDGEILGQVKTHTPPDQDSETTYTSNPHDYIRIDDETAWVTRNQPNLDPDAPELERGSDLLRIDPSSMERSDERIDLSMFETTVTRTNFETMKEEEVQIYAKPSRLTRVGGTLVVGLMRNSVDFSAHASGMVALFDLKTRKVSGLDLPDLIGCTKVLPIPGESERVLVTCGGDSIDVRATAGFAIVRVRDGKATLEQRWAAKDHEELPVLSGNSVALGGTLIAASSSSYSADEDSVFGTLDLASGKFSELLSIPGGTGNFGSPVYDTKDKLLLVPDSSADADMRPSAGVHVLTRGADGFEETDMLKVAEDTAMPARHVYPL